MVKAIKLGLLISIILVGFIFRGQIIDYFNTLANLATFFVPCERPINYTIGDVDSRFGVSRAELAEIALQAEQIWEVPANKNLFNVKDNARLKISLVYDERQSLTDQSGAIESNIDEGRKLYDSLEARYRLLLGQYQTRLTKYNQDVAYWNTQGGAPKDEYDRLVKEARSLNIIADQINDLVGQLNSLVKKLNLNVSQFNSVTGEFNETLTTKPEAGTFSAAEGSIIVYQFSDLDELKITLAHEFGHALSLDHIDVPDVLMNPKRDANTKLTDSDVNELKRVCRLDT